MKAVPSVSVATVSVPSGSATTSTSSTLSTVEAATLLGVHPNTVRKLYRLGYLGKALPGLRHIRLPRERVMSYAGGA